jgi:ketosteroid isomerase-like protein
MPSKLNGDGQCLEKFDPSTEEMFGMTKNIASLSVLIAGFGVCSAFAQKAPCTEEFIRANSSRPPLTEDFYLFNPIMEKPAIGKEERDKANAAIRSNAQLMANRKNFKGDPSKVDRVVVDPSGDMAYEYGTTRISFDQQDGKHVDAIHAFLRVWRVDGGSCKLAASMIQRQGERLPKEGER